MSRLPASIDEHICNEVQREMARVDTIRVGLNMHHAGNVFSEFWIRRAILRARHALLQRNMIEARRMLTVLNRISLDGF